ncbi:MAG TPA: MmgE/PrpD family protein [Stellaceae bacterium]|nr:MmgE/PrpD family protein [Stellaceae bacterium]
MEGHGTASQGVTATILAQVDALFASPLPDDVVEWSRHCVLDWLGVALAGAGEALTLALRDEARAEGGRPVASVLFHGDKISPTLAALVNAAMADALDFSDANPNIHGHTTPAIVAASLALAEANGASGRALLEAVVVGIEVACRVGLLAHGRLHPGGFHPTGTTVVFGAAAAAAHLLGLDARQRAHALGLAATQGAGLVASAGSMAKPFHSGKAAMNGILAASLARRGFTGRPDAIEAAGGFLSAHVREWSAAPLASCESRFLIRDTKFKAHAACALTHSSIENMLILMRRHAVTPDSIEQIELRVPHSSLGVCNIADPATSLEAKFSLKTVAAMALLGDATGDINAYDVERALRPEVKRLAARIVVAGADDLDGGEAVAIATLTDGRTLAERYDSYTAKVDLAAQRDALGRKFHALVAPMLGETRAARLAETVLVLDRAGSLTPLVALSANG